jgi:ubiquinone biosynthesis protein COQ4
MQTMPAWEPAWTFTRAMTRALIDSHDVDALLTGEEISSVGRMQALVPVLEATEEGRSLLRDRPRMSSATVDVAALRAMDPATLGRAYMDHLDRNGLDLDALTVPVHRGPSGEARWLLERVRQTHDVWHTLLGRSTQPHDEVLVHAFQWSQLRMPYSALVVGFGVPKHLVMERRWRALRHELPQMIALGRRAGPLIAQRWEWHWDEPVAEVRRRLGLPEAGLPA